MLSSVNVLPTRQEIASLASIVRPPTPARAQPALRMTSPSMSSETRHRCRREVSNSALELQVAAAWRAIGARDDRFHRNFVVRESGNEWPEDESRISIRRRPLGPCATT